MVFFTLGTGLREHFWHKGNSGIQEWQKIMPFKSEKQRKYLHANHPEIAVRWEKNYKKGGPVRVAIARGCGKVMSDRRKKTKYYT